MHGVLISCFEKKLPPGFGFHSACSNPKLVHLSFVDDLMIFCSSHLESLQAINDILAHFSSVSGMYINDGKSAIFFPGTNDEDKQFILSLLRFDEGKLSVKYLGVPLISTRLKREHCTILVDKVSSCINYWTARYLSYAERLQLINSVLRSIQVYWCSSFMLPKFVVNDIDKKRKSFLWLGRIKALKALLLGALSVNQKVRGGLGIKDLIS